MSEIKLKDIIQQALREDIGKGDITTNILMPVHLKVRAKILVKENGVVAGLDVAKEVFKTLDKKIIFKPETKDGNLIRRNQTVAYIQGNARAILSAERAALNFLTHLSGIAALTKKFVDKTKPYKVKIFDTRKTLPGLRQLEKYAVRCGGGFNHRMDLSKQVLIKDNHLMIINPKLKECIEKIRKNLSKAIKIEIEVKNLREFKDALKIKPDIIMLDNMRLADINRAVKLRRDRTPILEASGGVNLGNLAAIAKTGIDRVSIGALTHSAPALDFSLEII